MSPIELKIDGHISFDGTLAEFDKKTFSIDNIPKEAVILERDEKDTPDDETYTLVQRDLSDHDETPTQIVYISKEENRASFTVEGSLYEARYYDK